MTTQHFSISHTDETGTDTYLAALVDDAFHASRNSETPEELAQVEDACRFLAEDEDTLELALDSGRTVSKVTSTSTFLTALLGELRTAEAAERDAFTRYHAAPHTTRNDLWRAALAAREQTAGIRHQIGHLMAPTGKATATLTLGRETRTIAITSWASSNQPTVAYSDDFCGAFQKGPGCKVWRERIRFYAKDGRWVANTHMTILNRASYQLIGWADAFDDSARSQHNSSIG